MFPLEITKKMKDNEKKNMDDMKYKNNKSELGKFQGKLTFLFFFGIQIGQPIGFDTQLVHVWC